jgi:hypothetical protein
MDRRPTREEWQERELEFRHRPTGYVIWRYRGQSYPSGQNIIQDERGYDLGAIKGQGARLLQEQWGREVGGSL